MSTGVFTLMLLRQVYYILQEVFRSLRRNSLLNFAAVGTTAISLFVLGVGLLLVINTNQIAGTVESNIEITVYLKMDTTEKEALSLEPLFSRISGVKEVEFIPRDEALASLEGQLGEGTKKMSRARAITTEPTVIQRYDLINFRRRKDSHPIQRLPHDYCYQNNFFHPGAKNRSVKCLRSDV
jgi:hypothetical protein